MNLDRDAVAKIVMNTSMTMADLYRIGITSSSTNAQKENAWACAVAANNAGVFILQKLGFSNDEIKALVEGYNSK